MTHFRHPRTQTSEDMWGKACMLFHMFYRPQRKHEAASALESGYYSDGATRRIGGADLHRLMLDSSRGILTHACLHGIY